MARLVMKFGGTSVADIDRIRNVARHVRREVGCGHEVAVIVSAMAGETNKLVALCRSASALHDTREYDTVVASGEQVTAGLLAIVLQDMGVNARSWLGWQVPISTDAAHGVARISDIRGDLLIDESELSPLGTGADMAFLDHGADLHGEEEFGYCTNFMVFGDGFDFERVRDDIAAMGQSAVIVGDGEMLKVHIHTENPGQVLDYAIGLGTLDQIKIDNMAKQTATLAEQRATAMASHNSGTVDAVPVSIAIVAVASGEGLADALRTMGATCIVRGGQTMNPSTEDLRKAVQQAPCDDIILLPNNKNIILTANQVANLTERSVQVVPTISVPQALAALASFRPEQSLDANVTTMTGALENVLSLEITKAVRDVELNGVRIANGQTIGLIDDELAAAGNDAAGVARTLFARADAGTAELITVFSGNDASNDDIAALRQVVEDAFPGAESDFQVGGQPHYLFVIGVE
jgi:DAK2 domain fusion protein YloV